MNQLYLVRHGLAIDPSTPDISDDDRTLTPEGERRVRQVGRAFKRLDLKLDRIAASPLPRAHKTAEIIAEALGKPELVEVVDDLRAGRDAASIATWLESRTEGRLMVVGHNPGLSELLTRLVLGADHPPFCELHKGGIAALRGGPDGAYRVDWIARPRLFRR